MAARLRAPRSAAAWAAAYTARAAPTGVALDIAPLAGVALKKSGGDMRAPPPCGPSAAAH